MMSLFVLVLLGLVVAGALTYALAANPKAGEIGRVLFACALLALLLALAFGRVPL
jgi:hypothetical protein